jgi:DNA-directed RNA polymerase subunit RPC12/RpoP
MEKTLTSIRLDDEHSEDAPFFRCSECRGTFQKPLSATLSSRGYIQKYSACPHCLSKVTIVKQHESEEKKETAIDLGETMKASVVKDREDSAQCKHFLGYLKTRPKDMSVPDECLTCDRMIQCMVH